MLPRSRQLQYLATVAEEGQLTGAAKRLGLAQPALSQAIAGLEDELGVPLLDRGPRGIALTPAGDAFLTAARTALAAEDDALGTAEALARRERGELTIGFVGPPPALTAPALFGAFARRHPEADVSFRDLHFPHGRTSSWLALVDVAISHAPRQEAGVRIELLRSEPRAVVGRRDALPSGVATLAVADVLDETFVSYHADVQPEWAGFHSLDDHRGSTPANSTEDEVRTALQMLGIMSTDSHAITTFPYADAKLVQHAVPELAVIALSDADPAAISIAWRGDNENPLIDALLASAEELAKADGV